MQILGGRKFFHFYRKMNKAHEVQDSISRSNTNHYLATFCINHLVSSVFFVIVVMFIMYLHKKLLYNPLQSQVLLDGADSGGHVFLAPPKFAKILQNLAKISCVAFLC